MTHKSITSTESFAARAQRSEARRVALWIAVLVAMLLLTEFRHLAHGVVMSTSAVFYPTIGVLLIAIAVQGVLLWFLRRANRTGVLLSRWVWRGSAVFDLCTAAALLVVLAYWSPRGPIPALSAPALLLMPLVVLTSVLRLRPMFTLITGLGAAGIHLALAARAISVTGAPMNEYPVYLAYACILIFTGIAGALVAREVRAHVREAVEEATAHEHAQRRIAAVQHDLEVARRIQLGLLPTGPPNFPGFDITGMNRPADQTGGDYFDWQPLPDGRLAVVLADVSGHGIGPALMMAVCRAYARSAAPLIPDPVGLMGRLNDLLHDDLPDDRFITFVLAILDRSGEIRLLSAGHGPTLLFRAETRQIQQFDGDGIPLGVSPSEEYGPTTSLTMNDGDILVMLTDGFFEWSRPSDGEQFGIARLCQTLGEHAGSDAPTILAALDSAVRGFVDGSIQPDDMTAIVIKRTGVSAGASS